MIKQQIQVLPGDLEPGVHGHIIINSNNGIYEKRSLKLHWTVTEAIGLAVVNPRALAKLTIKKEGV